MIPPQSPQRSASHEDGLSLVEVIVYIVVSTIFLGLVTTVFVVALQSNVQASNRDLSTGRAQVANISLATSLRNAKSVRISNASGATVTTGSADGVTLRALVATAAGSWECRIWSFAGSQFRTKSYSAASVAPLLPAIDASWGTLATGVTGSFAAPSASRVTWSISIVSNAQSSIASTSSSASVAGGATLATVNDPGVLKCF